MPIDRRLSIDSRNVCLQALADFIDSGASNGYVEIRSGVFTSPDLPVDSNGGTEVLAVVGLSKPCGSVVSGELVFYDISPDTSVNATGEAAWGVVYNSDGVPAASFDISSLIGQGSMKLNRLKVSALGSFSIASFSIFIPMGD
jgi:hypothetical protein